MTYYTRLPLFMRMIQLPSEMNGAEAQKHHDPKSSPGGIGQRHGISRVLT